MQQNQVADIARQKLAQDLGIPAEDIVVEAVESVERPDPSLGLPEPDHLYAQVITPGYRILLKHGTQLHEYRTNETGSIMRYNPHP